MAALTPSPRPLDLFERWMIRQNVERIERGEVTAEDLLRILRHNGYLRVADAVAEAVAK